MVVRERVVDLLSLPSDTDLCLRSGIRRAEDDHFDEIFGAHKYGLLLAHSTPPPTALRTLSRDDAPPCMIAREDIMSDNYLPPRVVRGMALSFD